jgi:predicted N-acetyltransferase YhbS
MIDNFDKERYAPEMFEFRLEKSQDIAGIRKVHEAAFKTRAEADLVDALRDVKAYIISLVFMIKVLQPGALDGIPGIAKYHEAFAGF